eukprot:g2577.t1
MVFGQIVLGPPGSGKSTYCYGASNFLGGLGRRVAVINLDPANETAEYECAVDVRDLVSLEDVMEELHLGPNGGMIYAMEFLEANFDWLESEIEKVRANATNENVESDSKGGMMLPGGVVEPSGSFYFIFDLPGQVELTTHHPSLKNILVRLQRELDFQLVGVHLVDAHYCSDPAKYISASLLSLSTMLRLELPHVNVLSKMDLLENYGTLSQPLDFYTSGFDLERLLPDVKIDGFSENTQSCLPGFVEESGGVDCCRNNDCSSSTSCSSSNNSSKGKRKKTLAESFTRLNAAFCELVSDFQLVSFHTLDVSDKESIARLLRIIDKAVGYSGPGSAALASLPLDFDGVAHTVTERYSSAFGPPAKIMKNEASDSEKENSATKASTTERNGTKNTKPSTRSLISDDEWEKITKVHT